MFSSVQVTFNEIRNYVDDRGTVSYQMARAFARNYNFEKEFVEMYDEEICWQCNRSDFDGTDQMIRIGVDLEEFFSCFECEFYDAIFADM